METKKYTEGELKNFIFRDFFDDEVIEDEMDELEASISDELEAMETKIVKIELSKNGSDVK